MVNAVPPHQEEGASPRHRGTAVGATRVQPHDVTRTITNRHERRARRQFDRLGTKGRYDRHRPPQTPIPMESNKDLR